MVFSQQNLETFSGLTPIFIHKSSPAASISVSNALGYTGDLDAPTPYSVNLDDAFYGESTKHPSKDELEQAAQTLYEQNSDADDCMAMTTCFITRLEDGTNGQLRFKVSYLSCGDTQISHLTHKSGTEEFEVRDLEHNAREQYETKTGKPHVSFLNALGDRMVNETTHLVDEIEITLDKGTTDFVVLSSDGIKPIENAHALGEKLGLDATNIQSASELNDALIQRSTQTNPLDNQTAVSVQLNANLTGTHCLTVMDGQSKIDACKKISSSVRSVISDLADVDIVTPCLIQKPEHRSSKPTVLAQSPQQ